MLWTVRTRPGAGPDRWIGWDGQTWHADPDTRAEVEARGGAERVLFGAARVTPTGPVYTPTSATDPVALFLNAAGAISLPTVVEGTPPEIPAAVAEAAEVPPDAVA